jgi:hypothetical protein
MPLEHFRSNFRYDIIILRVKHYLLRPNEIFEPTVILVELLGLRDQDLRGVSAYYDQVWAAHFLTQRV